MSTQTESLNDELQIHISVKRAIQIGIMIFSITGAYYQLTAKIDANKQELNHIKEALIEFEQALDDRMEPLENEREQRLNEMNKSLLDKVLRKDN